MKELKSYRSSYDLVKSAPMSGPWHGERKFDWIDLVCWAIALVSFGSSIWLLLQLIKM